MRRWLLALLLLVPVTACKKANEEDCRKAIENVLTIRGVATQERAAEIEAEVRKCRSTASPDEVACLIKAKTGADLDACEGKRK